MKVTHQPYNLKFKTPVLTSRGSMDYKHGYYLQIEHEGVTGIGECSYIEGLSIDHLGSYVAQLSELAINIYEIADIYQQTGGMPAELLMRYPSIAFGLETALRDLANGGKKEIIKDSSFYKGKVDIPINGLIWMGTDTFMEYQIEEKLAQGFFCIKLKIGAIDFKEECRLIEGIRKKYGPDKIEIRLDANGAFDEDDVCEKLTTLSQFSIHSIEQPVKAQQYLLMHELCHDNIIPIALDEELIGTDKKEIKQKLLETIRPHYIILKPSLLGGFHACDEWIHIAEGLGIDWWATSALESNIGLNAIAQWAASKNESMTHGLGTGGLYTNNLSSPLYIDKGCLKYNTSKSWDKLD